MSIFTYSCSVFPEKALKAQGPWRILRLSWSRELRSLASGRAGPTFQFTSPWIFKPPV